MAASRELVTLGDIAFGDKTFGDIGICCFGDVERIFGDEGVLFGEVTDGRLQ